MKNHFQRLLWLLLLFLLTLALYGPTLAQPYFWDDIIHYHFATTRSLGQIWTNVTGLAYYRPLTFTLYKVLFAAPSGSTVPAHLCLLLIHTANAWLVGWLAYRLLARLGSTELLAGLGLDEAGGLLASLLFVLYPFAVLPVSHFAAVMHPLVTLFTLGATVSALGFAQTRRKGWLVPALGLALLAPYVHESGIMAGFVAAWVLLLHRWPPVRRDFVLLVALPGAGALFLPVWLLVPKSPGEFQWLSGEGLLAKIAFFVQGPTYPLQPLSRQLMDRFAQWYTGVAPATVGLPWWVLAVIWAVAGLALFVAALLLRRTRLLHILGIALGWTFLMALPALMTLPFPYITVSQRLLYASGPAAALLWAAVCASAAVRLPRPARRLAVMVILALAIVAVPLLYIRREIDLHQLALRPLEQLAEISGQFPGERHLVINPPNWVNNRQPWYALGHEGVSVSAEYVYLDDLVGVNAGSESEFVAATVPSIKVETSVHAYSTIGEELPWDEAMVAAQAPAYDHVWLVTYSDERIAVEEAGAVRDGPARPPAHYLASFEDRVYLVEATLEVEEEVAVATLDWQILEGFPDVTIFRHLTGCDGNLLSQGDGLALGRTLSFSLLTPGTRVRDVRRIPLQAGAGDDCYMLWIGLYHSDGVRVPAYAPDGTPFPDNAVPLSPRASGIPRLETASVP